MEAPSPRWMGLFNSDNGPSRVGAGRNLVLEEEGTLRNYDNRKGCNWECLRGEKVGEDFGLKKS